MKKLLFIAVAFFSIQLASAQESPKSSIDENAVYTSTEIQPEFPGGMSKCREFIDANLKLPQEQIPQEKMPKKKKDAEKVFVQFVVEKDGSLTDIKAMGDVANGRGEEAERVVSIMPKWSHAIQNGHIVRCKLLLVMNQNKNPKP